MSDFDEIMVGALEKCKSRESIEDVFNRFQVTGSEDKMKRLTETMGNPQTFFGSQSLSIEDKYELTVQMFLTMSWKLSEYYKRIGGIS
jgi:hypothetical protein